MKKTNDDFLEDIANLLNSKKERSIRVIIDQDGNETIIFNGHYNNLVKMVKKIPNDVILGKVVRDYVEREE